MLDYIGCMLGIYGMSFLFGLPAFFALSSDYIKRYGVVFCPLFGVSIGMIVMFYLNVLGISVCEMVYPLVFSFAILDGGLYYWKRISLSGMRVPLILAVGCLIVCTVWFALPGVLYNHNNLTIIDANNDFCLYTVASNAIRFHGAQNACASSNPETISAWILGHQPRFVDYWIALVAEVFGLSIFNAASLVSIYLYGLVVIAGTAFTFMLSAQRKTSFFAAILLFLNCNYHYLFVQGFIAQLFSISIMVGITMLFFVLVESEEPKRKESCAFGILLAGMMATYAEMVSLALLPIFAILCYSVIKNRLLFYKLWENGRFAIGTTSVLFGWGIYISIKGFFWLQNYVAGWDITKGYILQALGVYNAFLPHFFNIHIWNSVVIIAISCCLLFLMWQQTGKIGGGKRVLVLRFYLVSYSVAYLILFLRYDLYKTFKGMANMSYFFIVLAVVILCMQRNRPSICQVLLLFGKKSFEKVEDHLLVYKKSIPISQLDLFLSGGISILLIFCVAISGLGVYVPYWAEAALILQPDIHLIHNEIGKEHAELQTLLDNTDTEAIYVVGLPYWDNLAALTMLASFPAEKIKDVEQWIWRTHPEEVPESNALVISMTTAGNPIDYVGEQLLENSVYTVKKINFSYPFYLPNGRKEHSFYINPHGYAQDGWKILSGSTKFQFYIVGNQTVEMYLKLDCEEDTHAEITLPNGENIEIAMFKGENIFHFSKVPFKSGDQNFVSIRSKEENITLRRLSFRSADFYAPLMKVTFINAQAFLQSIWTFLQSSWNEIYHLSTLKKNQEISFLPSANPETYVVKDSLWSEEATGRWSKDEVKMVFLLDEPLEDRRFVWDGEAYLENYRIHAWINNVDLGFLIINKDRKIEPLLIPKNFLNRGKNRLILHVENAVSPLELGKSSDARPLGIFFQKIRME